MADLGPLRSTVLTDREVGSQLEWQCKNSLLSQFCTHLGDDVGGGSKLGSGQCSVSEIFGFKYVFRPLLQVCLSEPQHFRLQNKGDNSYLRGMF